MKEGHFHLAARRSGGTSFISRDTDELFRARAAISHRAFICFDASDQLFGEEMNQRRKGKKGLG